MRRTYIALFFLVAILSSCNKDAPTSPSPSGFTHAKVGSTFTFDEYLTDSTKSISAGSRDTMVGTILRTDGATANKTEVLFIEENRGGVRDTAYYVYEENNNLSVLTNASDLNLAMWETLPTGTGTTIVRATGYSIIGIDTTDFHDSTITSLLGTENITIKGQTMTVKKMLLSFRHATKNTTDGAIESKVDNLFYFAPSIGYVVKTESTSRPEPFGGWIDGMTQTLIDYKEK